MKIIAEKITGINLAHWATEMTMPEGFKASASLKKIYGFEHSLTRTQEFKIELTRVPYFVQGHLTRHKLGVEFYCRSKRPDRGGEGNDVVTRNTPVDFAMKINAEALLTMSHRRLCFQASPETRETMIAIKEAVRLVDPDLAYYMVPFCIYKGGTCSEPKPCGNYHVVRMQGEDDEKLLRTPNHKQMQTLWEGNDGR